VTEAQEKIASDASTRQFATTWKHLAGEQVERRVADEAHEPAEERGIDAADAIAQRRHFDDVTQGEQQGVDEQDELEAGPVQRIVEKLQAGHAVLQVVEELHQRAGHRGDVVQAPVDHQRREEELEQHRKSGLLRGWRQVRLQRQAPAITLRLRAPRARHRPLQPQRREIQALQQQPGLGVQPRIAQVVGNQHHDIEPDQDQEHGPHVQDGVDLEHPELPLGLELVAMECAGVRDDPPGDPDERQRR
jgi:hypothetical protein